MGEFYTGDVYNPNITKGVSKTTKGSSHFFNKLKKISKEKADEIVSKKAENMKYILTHRQSLQGTNGRYPRFKGKSKKSFWKWETTPQSNGNIKLTNSAQGWGGFNYPLLLMYGNAGGSYHWNFDTSKSKNVNSMGFSTQMPNGINPWLRIKVNELKEELQKALSKDI
jgi:hypothetical protein